jgi:SWI/SNF-related matrix-associated actin-dependent regulator 1 of chromatin subfamily A
VPRAEALALAGALEALGTTLLVFARRPFVRFRASLVRGSQEARLLSTETPGQSAREALGKAGFRAVRKPKSLVHEFVGPVTRLHLLAEELGLGGNAVVLAESAGPPAFEPLSAAVPTPPAPRPPPSARTPLVPIVFSRQRFDWWTPRVGLSPLALAILQRHGAPLDKGIRFASEGLRQAERELLGAGLHSARVEDAPPVMVEASAGPAEGEARALVKGRTPSAPVVQALHAHGYRTVGIERSDTAFEGPTANLPALALALAAVGAHLVPGPDGWPPLPESQPEPSTPSVLAADDPRAHLSREGTLARDNDKVVLRVEPPHAVLPRSLRIDLYRMGWLASDGRVVASASDAGRLVALLRDGGFDVKWPKPASGEWRLATVRYHERGRRDTLVHLKGPIPLGRLGGVDPAAEAARIRHVVEGMEKALAELHPDARPAAHGALPGVFSVSGGAGEFLLLAASKGASVTPSAALQPMQLGRGVVLVDQTCLPPRLVEFRRSTVLEEGPRRPVVTPDIENVVRRVVPEGLEVDEQRGHYLVPSTKIVPLVEALRELGAKVIQRRLAPRGQRYQRWQPELPEDATGARPKLRPPWRGAPYEGAVPGLRKETKLDPHQREGLAFILHHQHSCLLADEMGLGKTLTAISAAQFLPGRVLVVCPASARAVWRQEVRAWTTESSLVLSPGDDPALAAQSDAKYVVVAYSGLQKFGDALAAIPFDLVVLDESHYVKSRGALRTRLVNEKLARVPRRLILSGTPVMNEPQEIRTQLAFVHPDEWSDTAWFGRRFQQPWKYGSPDVREQVLARLRQYLDGVMLRREKRQALPDLPEKHLHVTRLALPEEARRAYEQQEDEFRDYLHDHEDDALTRGMAETAGHLEHLKQAVLVGKLPLIVAQLQEWLAEGEKLVVFCHYREPIKALAKELAEHGVVTLTGSTKPEDRATSVERFQKDPEVKVFIGQTVAAGVAVTLTAARRAVFCDLEWNPALHRQAMDRIHRKTQTRDVEVHFFLAEDTVEEDIAEVLEEKTEMMDMLLEGRAGGGLGLRDKEAAQREVALRILSRRRRAMVSTVDEDEE